MDPKLAALKLPKEGLAIPQQYVTKPVQEMGPRQRDGQIYRTIAEGAPGMPAYGASLTQQQIWELSGTNTN